MHSDICEPVWFKIGIMIVATELYILILVYMTLTIIQGHREERKQNFCSSFLPKLWTFF